MPVEELRALLKAHDWFYEYSDDPSIWHRGNAQREKIVRLMRSLASRSPETGKEAAAAWKELSPKSVENELFFTCPI
jgi:hypothetical protein